MKFRKTLTALLLLLALDGVALAAPVPFPASKDNSLYQSATGSLSNGQGIFVFAGKTNEVTNSLRRGLVAFDLSTIPTNATVTAASLSLYLVKMGPVAPGNITVNKALRNWGEGNSNAGNPGGHGVPAQTNDATWLHAFFNSSFWTTPGGDFLATPSATAFVEEESRYHVWSGPGLIADVQAWVSNPVSNFGWFIIGNEVDPGSAAKFGTSEHGTATSRPRLDVTFQISTPTPTPTPSPTPTPTPTLTPTPTPTPPPPTPTPTPCCLIDNCFGAELIPPDGFPLLTSLTADITNATTLGDPATPSCQANVSRSLWYKFAPQFTSIYRISSCANAPTGTTVDDTVMAIYTSTGGCNGPFTEITGTSVDGCDDDGCGTQATQAVITTGLLSGTTYYIVVWKSGAAAPTPGHTAVQLRVTRIGPPTPTPTLSPPPTATPTTTPTPTPTPTPPPSPTPTPTPTPPPTPTPTPPPSPTPTPTPSPAQALNIATRMRIETGNNVLIGGFIVTGTAPKNVAVRGIGPSLALVGIPELLADPTLQLRDSSGALVMQNDNWQDDPTQAFQLTTLGLALQNPNESGMVATLSPSAYTAILAGKNGGTGVGLLEIYDTNPAVASQLANISTRGFVLTGTNVMIGGFILGGNQNTHVAVRGIGPSLSQLGLSPVLADPTLELHDGNGALLVSNDDWEDDPLSASALSALGLALTDAAESGIHTSLPPGAFTAILAGSGGGTGIGLVEIYNVQ